MERNRRKKAKRKNPKKRGVTMYGRKTKDVKITIRIDEDLDKRIDNLCEVAKTDKSTLLRTFVESGLNLTAQFVGQRYLT